MSSTELTRYSSSFSASVEKSGIVASSATEITMPPHPPPPSVPAAQATQVTVTARDYPRFFVILGSSPTRRGASAPDDRHYSRVTDPRRRVSTDNPGMTARCLTCGRFVGPCQECGARYCGRCQPIQHDHSWEPKRKHEQGRRRGLRRLLAGRRLQLPEPAPGRAGRRARSCRLATPDRAGEAVPGLCPRVVKQVPGIGHSATGTGHDGRGPFKRPVGETAQAHLGGGAGPWSSRWRMCAVPA
jgi:hypothetical protein